MPEKYISLQSREWRSDGFYAHQACQLKTIYGQSVSKLEPALSSVGPQSIFEQFAAELIETSFNSLFFALHSLAWNVPKWQQYFELNKPEI